MKDFFGQELAVGDIVAFELPKYRELTKGIIMSFTPQNVRVAYQNPLWGKTTVEYTDARGTDWNAIFLISPRALIKAPIQP